MSNTYQMKMEKALKHNGFESITIGELNRLANTRSNDPHGIYYVIHHASQDVSVMDNSQGFADVSCFEFTHDGYELLIDFLGDDGLPTSQQSSIKDDIADTMHYMLGFLFICLGLTLFAFFIIVITNYALNNIQPTLQQTFKILLQYIDFFQVWQFVCSFLIGGLGIRLIVNTAKGVN